MIAMSGGGKRSASFAYGALKGMRDVTVATAVEPRSLLDQIDAISGVSGGSFPASHYDLYREKTFGQFETDFLYDDTNSYIAASMCCLGTGPGSWNPGSAPTISWTASTTGPCS